MQNKGRLLLGLTGGLIVIAACLLGWPMSYTVSVSNISPNGEYGVILFDFPARSQFKQKDEGQGSNELYLYPWVERLNFGAFAATRFRLPDTLELKWQLARLSKCESLNVYRSPPGHTRKRFCKWQPVADKVFQKTIDLRRHNATDAFRSKGDYKSIGGMIRKTARLTIVFTDDQVNVAVEAGATNPWR